MVQFRVNAFDTTVDMTQSAQVDSTTYNAITADASAKIYVSLEQFRNMFKFQTDAVDIDTIKDGTDVQYFTDSSVLDAASNLNPFAAHVETGHTNGNNQYADNHKTVRHDFVRKIAFDVFKTEKAVDIFENETELLDDLTTLGLDVHTSLVSKIDNASGLESDNTTDNITKDLIDQLLALEPTRFEAIDGDDGTINDTAEAQSVPFKEGDTMRYLLTVNPTAGVVVAGLAEPQTKTYEIIMEMRSEVNKGTHDNQPYDDDAGSTYAGRTDVYYSKIHPLQTSFTYTRSLTSQESSYFLDQSGYFRTDTITKMSFGGYDLYVLANSADQLLFTNVSGSNESPGTFNYDGNIATGERDGATGTFTVTADTLTFTTDIGTNAEGRTLLSEDWGTAAFTTVMSNLDSVTLSEVTPATIADVQLASNQYVEITFNDSSKHYLTKDSNTNEIKIYSDVSLATLVYTMVDSGVVNVAKIQVLDSADTANGLALELNSEGLVAGVDRDNTGKYYGISSQQVVTV